jgi:hypothetical protein
MEHKSSLDKTDKLCQFLWEEVSVNKGEWEGVKNEEPLGGVRGGHWDMDQGMST